MEGSCWLVAFCVTVADFSLLLLASDGFDFKSFYATGGKLLVICKK